MSLNRREFMQVLSVAAVSGMLTNCSSKEKDNDSIYDKKIKNDSIRLLHFTDCHAQLNPIYFREPNVNIGINSSLNRPPHLVGKSFVEEFNITDPVLKHAFTYLDFDNAAKKYGKVGGFAHLKTLVNKLRNDFGAEKTLLMDGGDTWQGSGTSYWTNGQDMVKACNLLGVDLMTGHWEFTYPEEIVRKNLEMFKGEFVAQNIRLTEDAVFAGAQSYDEGTGHAFKPYSIKTINGHTVAIIGQAFPYTPIANPKRFVENWSFGIRPDEMQEIVNEVHDKYKPTATIMLSHNGMDVDIKLASLVSGIDVIFGGHTHDAIPKPLTVKNPGGVTLVTNAGSNGKYLASMDLSISASGKISGYDYNLYPIFANMLEADKEMENLITDIRKPYLDKLNEPLATTDGDLYRRGNFNGTFDQMICDALRDVKGADISLSPGFRWGTSILAGQTIKMEHVLDQTCITYPNTYVSEMTGENIKTILEDVLDNLFNEDPFYQQGGDMVRVGGMDYVCDLSKKFGNRISEMTLDNGKKVDANKKYKVAGWAAVNSIPDGEPIWDVVSKYLKSQKTIKINKMNTPKILGIGSSNKGIEIS